MYTLCRLFLRANARGRFFVWQRGQKGRAYWRALLCALLVALMLPTAGFAAAGKTVYLKNTGSDANDGSTAAKAVQTLDKALELAGPGGTILMGQPDLGQRREDR